MWRHFAVLCVLLLGVLAVRAQDVTSGPTKDEKVPALKVLDLTGSNKDKEVDYAAERKDKPTIYYLIDREKFTRPMNKFMKTLDTELNKDVKDAYVVAVFLTDDKDAVKDFLPKVQQSVQYEATALTLFTGEKSGPKDWNVNGDAHITVVVANKGKVVATFGYNSINDTDVKGVREALDKALKK
jgi:menaquinone-dependent protoporphyrinogen IX oxidase